LHLNFGKKIEKCPFYSSLVCKEKFAFENDYLEKKALKITTIPGKTKKIYQKGRYTVKFTDPDPY
jgi:hypothetical protein